MKIRIVRKLRNDNTSFYYAEKKGGFKILKNCCKSEEWNKLPLITIIFYIPINLIAFIIDLFLIVMFLNWEVLEYGSYRICETYSDAKFVADYHNKEYLREKKEKEDLKQKEWDKKIRQKHIIKYP